jgi:hypothetical protein
MIDDIILALPALLGAAVVVIAFISKELRRVAKERDTAIASAKDAHEHVLAVTESLNWDKNWSVWKLEDKIRELEKDNKRLRAIFKDSIDVAAALRETA